MTRSRTRIVLGVTSSVSVGLTSGLAQHLAARGWDVHVASGPGAALDSLAADGVVEVHEIHMRREPAVISDFRALVRWILLLRHLAPDIVMVGTPKAGLLGLVAAAAARVPVRVYFVRGLRLETASGVRRSMLTLFERLAFRVATSSVAVSSSLRERVIDMRLVSAGKIKVLGRGSSNGVDTARFAPADRTDKEVIDLFTALKLTPGVPVIGFVGRLHHDKGVHVLAEASEKLAKRRVPHQLLIVGASEETEAEGALSSLIDSPNPPICVGEVNDTAPYYRVMDVFCLPTLREGFPNVVLEASASGLPVVTTDATGAVDSVVPGATGLISESGNSESLADALQEILSLPDLAASMGDAGRVLVRSDFESVRVWSLTFDYLDRLRSSLHSPGSSADHVESAPRLRGPQS